MPRSTAATSRSGTSACRSSTRSSPTSSTSTSSTRPRSFPRRSLPVRVIARLTLDRVVDNVFAETEQVAFCTQNVVPGIDFTNDPLLQGRNFSYLDTQLKRLGSPNFNQLPVNAPRCPVMHFQRDGHMQTDPQLGRGNYEPNSLTGDDRGPRADLVQGYQSVMRQEQGADPPAAGRVLRRPLQPGPAVLHQPDRRGARAHHRLPSASSSARWRTRRSAPGCWPTSRNVHDDLAQGVADKLGHAAAGGRRGRGADRARTCRSRRR